MVNYEFLVASYQVKSSPAQPNTYSSPISQADELKDDTKNDPETSIVCLEKIPNKP